MPSRVCGWVVAIACAAAAALSAQSGSREPTRDVVFAVEQSGWIHVLDAESLATLGRIAAKPLAMSVSVSSDGRTLFVGQGYTAGDGAFGCCGLYAFELAARRSCLLLDIAQDGVPSPDGRWLFASRNGGRIEVFDLPTLTRLPAIEAGAPSGGYRAFPSPDGRWLLAFSHWPTPALDLFDMQRGGKGRRIDAVGAPAGWVGDTFYLLHHRQDGASLARLDPATGQIAQQPLTGATLPERGQLAIAGGDLLHFRRSAPWLIMGPGGRAIAGDRGIRVIDPRRVQVTTQLVPTAEVADVAANAAGSIVYVVQPGAEHADAVSLLRVDRTARRVTATRTLSPGGWRLATAAVPASLMPSGDVTFASCQQ